MTTLRVELQVRDYDLWREAFESDAGGRQQSGMRRYRIFRPTDDARCVMLDADFEGPQVAPINRDPENFSAGNVARRGGG